ncbi:hypothetical protein NERG_01830 [Nematocida ausubeli]|uniref:Uncharacterized protein n=1 Tax=Nematocida ausubeli (strain ATCC PRA-371 / ERTm2) TaxID=1913371 RepID=H8ZE09_NEMA1|nr:hypothetical protein NERG_01830 [Nematocida ausubeli]
MKYKLNVCCNILIYLLYTSFQHFIRILKKASINHKCRWQRLKEVSAIMNVHSAGVLYYVGQTPQSACIIYSACNDACCLDKKSDILLIGPCA